MGLMPWNLRPPAWSEEGIKPEPRVYIFIRGVVCPVSPKSYAKRPLVIEGQEAGSMPIILTSDLPFSFSSTKGAIRPPKLDPPPMQPITISGFISYLSQASFVSRPITDWWSRTWSRTLPSTYLQLSDSRATSIASEIAQPKEPPVPGFSSRILRPTFVVSDGEGIIFPP